MTLLSYITSKSTQSSNTIVNPTPALTIVPNCVLLIKISAELRNQIYYYVFSEDSSPRARIRTTTDKAFQAREELSDHNPLALLQTCRQINSEATMIAWQTHSFLISHTLPCYILRKRASSLSAQRVSAVSRLTYDITEHDQTHPYYHQNIANFLAHAVMFLPNLGNIRILSPRKGFRDHNPDFARRNATTCRAHVPPWFVQSLERFVSGNIIGDHRWQTGDKWTLDWPHHHIHSSNRGYQEPLNEELWCNGDCSGVLLHEGAGRQVTVTLVYLWYSRRGSPPVYLVENVEERLPVQQTCSDTGLDGISYDPGEKYWRERQDLKLHESDRTIFGFKPGGVADAAKTLWQTSLVKLVWVGLKPKDVTVLKVPEHLKNGTVKHHSLEGFGFDSREDGQHSSDRTHR